MGDGLFQFFYKCAIIRGSRKSLIPLVGSNLPIGFVKNYLLSPKVLAYSAFGGFDHEQTVTV